MKRVLIKLSGEGLSNKEKRLSIDPQVVSKLVQQIKKIVENGTQVGIVVGGGNFWRGAAAEKNGIPRNRADYIGMLATIMNGLALQSAFEVAGMKARIQSALSVDQKVAENYINEKAITALERNEVLIFAGGTGRPYFTTDTAATLVACEIKAEVILMGKNGVDGIYDSDPKTNANAKKFEEITYDELLEKDLSVMDSTAASMARDNSIELLVFDITKEDALLKVIKGEQAHTKVKK